MKGKIFQAHLMKKPGLFHAKFTETFFEIFLEISRHPAGSEKNPTAFVIRLCRVSRPVILRPVISAIACLRGTFAAQ
jgi:hypothetical protein